MDTIQLEDEYYEGLGSPESKLWCAVIAMFIKDVQVTRKKLLKSYNGTAQKYSYELGMLKRCLWDMDIICDYAGVDYELFKKQMEKVFSGELVIDVDKTYL